MPSRRRLLLALSLLAGCPSRTPPDPPPGELDRDSAPGGDEAAADSGPAVTGVVAAPPAPDDPDAPDEPGEADASERPTAPRLAAPKSDNQLADTLKPRGSRSGVPQRSPATGGCEGGARRTGETWKVDCNECSCGDDGQTTCTAMACGAPSR